MFKRLNTIAIAYEDGRVEFYKHHGREWEPSWEPPLHATYYDNCMKLSEQMPEVKDSNFIAKFLLDVSTKNKEKIFEDKIKRAFMGEIETLKNLGVKIQL